MKRSGTADLPLHGGNVPRWLADRMTAMGGVIVEAIVAEGGPRELLRRLSDPFWFQALGCVMGMDWHSSGVTTSVVGALKRAINPRSGELGLAVCGGRGRYSRLTPAELLEVSDRFGLDGHALARASRLSAKVDNTCVQDGFTLYLHSFVVDSSGDWAVVQQGMDPSNRLARRYHWHSAEVRSFVESPQSAIIGENQGSIVNLSDRRARPAQRRIVEFLHEAPDRQLREVESLLRSAARAGGAARGELFARAEADLEPEAPRRLSLPSRHEVTAADVDPRRLGAVLALAYERGVQDFPEALLLEGVGPRTLLALALVSEVIYGEPVRFEDPARFAFAHGGKDGHPFPVPLDVYDESISFLRRAVERSHAEGAQKLAAVRKLGEIARRIETHRDPFADVEGVITAERRDSPRYHGRTVMGAEALDATPAKREAGPKARRRTDPADGQLSLF